MVLKHIIMYWDYFYLISQLANWIFCDILYCRLRLGKNYQEYCNKQALICNKLRTVSKIGGDTPSHKATAVQAQRFSEKSEQVSSLPGLGVADSFLDTPQGGF